MFFASLQFSISTTLPIILLMVAGVFLRRKKFIDEAFCQTASKLVFNFTLPIMLFLNMQKGKLDYQAHLSLVLTGIVGTLITYFLAEYWASKHIKERTFRAVFVQGTFRSNVGILGLALVVNAYGNEAVAGTSVYVACLIILFNILAVITLTKSFAKGKMSIRALLFSILKNQLILAVIAGLVVNYYQISLPTPLLKTGQTIASMTLPLALICTGASIDFKALKQFKRQQNEDNRNYLVLLSAMVRLIIAPIILFSLGKWVFQLNAMELGIIFLTGSSPVAAATYAMVRHYGGDATSTANLIGITTVGSMFSSTIGLLLLRQLGWI